MLLGGESVSTQIQIPFHATGKNIDPYNYGELYAERDTKYQIYWGRMGILVEVPSKYDMTLNKILGLR